MILTNPIATEVFPFGFRKLELLLRQNQSIPFNWSPNSHGFVDNCKDAAVNRAIRLPQEMKSLALKLRDGVFMFHFKGNELICRKKINDFHKEQFGRKSKVRLVRPADVSSGLITKGLVNPFLTQYWDWSHIYSPSLFEEKELYTNDGTFTGYVRFAPQLIKLLPNSLEAEFVKSYG